MCLKRFQSLHICAFDFSYLSLIYYCYFSVDSNMLSHVSVDMVVMEWPFDIESEN